MQIARLTILQVGDSHLERVGGGWQTARVPHPLQLHHLLHLALQEEGADRLAVQRQPERLPLHGLQRVQRHVHRQRVAHVLRPLLGGVLRVALEQLEVRSDGRRHGRVEEEKEGVGSVAHRAVGEGEPGAADDEEAVATGKGRREEYVPV